MIKVSDISGVIEEFAPCHLQEHYDNTGMQVGNPDQPVSGVLLCLDITSDILAEAQERGCNMIICHHPLLFGGIKHIVPSDERGRIVMNAIKAGISIYAAHTNLDRASDGVSYEIANTLNLMDIKVLSPDVHNSQEGLGVIGNIVPMPALAFLRQLKEEFSVGCLRYSQAQPRLTVRRVAVCGGAGASLIGEAIRHHADVFVTGDVKYHDFTSYAGRILIADIGHYESELCTRKIFAGILRERFPELTTYFADNEVSPINYM